MKKMMLGIISLSSISVVSMSKADGPKCPRDMIYVDGEYCPNVSEHCVEWMDDSSLPYARCKKYNPTTCNGNTVHMNFCIDKEEMHDSMGMPYGDKTWNQCKSLCEQQGRRLCSDAEWTKACEGPNMHPYPYLSGYEWSFTACNVYKRPLTCDAHGEPNMGGDRLCDYRANISEYGQCVSEYGVHDLAGDVDEWTTVPTYIGHGNGLVLHSALKGGHFLFSRTRCRVITLDHGEDWSNPQTTGCRCCGETK